MRHYYYTIYRKDYLYKGLVLYESMERHDPDFKFFVVCMEDESVELLKKLNYAHLVPINIKEIEAYDTRIPELKCQRGEKTYVWTAKASVPLYLFERYPEIDHVIWVDGDTEFMSSPEPIYQQWADYSVLLTEEKFYGQYEYLGHLVGFYNTGFMGFKKDEGGLQALKYFRERLQEWKNSEEEQVNWNDQLYVDDWTERFSNIGVVKHNGINLTPFIASRVNAEEWGYVHMKDGIPYIKDTPIVLYHFMALKYYDGNEFDLCYYWMKFDVQTIKILYLPYFKKCNDVFEKIGTVDPNFYPPLTKRFKYIGNYFNQRLNTEEAEYHICTVANRDGLPQTLALFESIKRYNLKFKMWICCQDQETYNKLSVLKLPEVQLFEAYNLIEYYDRLQAKGYSASREVLKARLINLIMLNNYNVKSILYVDHECYFHQNPKSLFDMITGNSITLVQDKTQQAGASISNSVIGFCRDQTALDCIFYWVEETKKWIDNGNTVEDELKHIGHWISKYSKVQILKRPCWLLNDKMLGNVTLRKYKDKVIVNNEELLLYQHKVPLMNENNFNEIIEQILKISSISKKHIYMPYLKSIKSCLGMLKKNGL